MAQVICKRLLGCVDSGIETDYEVIEEDGQERNTDNTGIHSRSCESYHHIEKASKVVNISFL
jgi:hypothetical protein